MKDIKSLLNKYWDGNTSIQEEAELKAYFQQKDIEPKLSKYKALFNHFADEREVKMPDSFRWDTSLLEPSTKVRSIVPMIRNIAAVLILVMGGLFVFQNNLQPSSRGAEVVQIEDPEEALEYTKQALAMLSKNYSKGTAQVSTNIGEARRLEIIK